jgi:hypothetical protein
MKGRKDGRTEGRKRRRGRKRRKEEKDGGEGRVRVTTVLEYTYNKP